MPQSLFRLIVIINLAVWPANAWTFGQVAAPAAPPAISQQSAKELGNVVADYVDQDFAVGAELLVVQHGEPIYHEVFGQSDRVDKTPWTKGTV